MMPAAAIQFARDASQTAGSGNQFRQEPRVLVQTRVRTECRLGVAAVNVGLSRPCVTKLPDINDH
jgi:hypothetical protein